MSSPVYNPPPEEDDFDDPYATDPFAEAHNLRYLWPCDTTSHLKKLIDMSANTTIKLYENEHGIVLESTLKDGPENNDPVRLAVFPHEYSGPLYVIFRKWDYYFRIYMFLRETSLARRPKKAAWKADLLDSWGRSVLYLERVLEAAIQWANGIYGPDTGSRCHVLRLFVAQEMRNTNHSCTITKDFDIAPDDVTALDRSKPSQPHDDPTLTRSTHAAIHDWQVDDDGTRMWLFHVTQGQVAEDVNNMLDRARPDTMRVSPIHFLSPLYYDHLTPQNRFSSPALRKLRKPLNYGQS